MVNERPVHSKEPINKPIIVTKPISEDLKTTTRSYLKLSRRVWSSNLWKYASWGAKSTSRCPEGSPGAAYQLCLNGAKLGSSHTSLSNGWYELSCINSRHIHVCTTSTLCISFSIKDNLICNCFPPLKFPFSLKIYQTFIQFCDCQLSHRFYENVVTVSVQPCINGP